MTPTRLAIALVVSLLVAACKDGNPVALPTDTGGTADELTITVSSDRGQLETGTTTPATLQVVALRRNGQPPKSPVNVTLNTSLGNFGVDATGKELTLVTRPLDGGRANVQFYSGSKAGTASILAQVGTNVGSLNLTVVEPPAAPVANFTFAATGLSVLFTDTSAGATSVRWQFGDGSESTDRNPRHVYAAAGSYVVTLTATNSGGSSEKNQFVTVSLGDPPTAKFTYTISGHQVNFVDQSVGATSWLWVFGDGTSSGQRNPIKTYALAGTYTVSLTASNAAGSNTVSEAITITDGAPPVAKFAFTVTGKQANFVDQSTGATSWSWDFGDGSQSSERNPVHTYASAGSYTVVLTVSNTAGSSQASQVVTVAAGTPPEAAFAFEVAGFQANFVDKSKGTPTSWLWNFGDGTTSTQQNPIHTYKAAGKYTVTLTATNENGSNSASNIVTIAAPAGPVANFTFTTVEGSLQVNFVDASTGNPTSWSWRFGDGSQSGLRNPVHTYAAPGTYTVQLTVSNANGSDSIAKTVTVK
ncbi:MAG TPA: PKD domain-containing protein [Thermoanaerobaculia bacterium]|nr:PKD domain-containing protein [Thermoanaerobaculia bacterium]